MRVPGVAAIDAAAALVGAPAVTGTSRRV